MSLAIGKRNFDQSLNDNFLTDFSRINLYQSKLYRSMDSCARSHQQQTKQDLFTQNIEELKRLFKDKDPKELEAVLEDCDNYLEIAIEILGKSIHQTFEPAVLKPERNIRKFESIGDKIGSNKLPSKCVFIMENKSDKNQILEEDVPPNVKMDEMRSAASIMISKLLQTSSNDDHTEVLARMLYDFTNENQKKLTNANKKLNDDKSLLIKVFSKQRQKVQDLQDKNHELANLYANHEMEIANLKTLNYKLALRLKYLDPTQNEECIRDIF